MSAPFFAYTNTISTAHLHVVSDESIRVTLLPVIIFDLSYRFRVALLFLPLSAVSVHQSASPRSVHAGCCLSVSRHTAVGPTDNVRRIAQFDQSVLHSLDGLAGRRLFGSTPRWREGQAFRSTPATPPRQTHSQACSLGRLLSPLALTLRQPASLTHSQARSQ
jgi:hypothetical protein